MAIVLDGTNGITTPDLDSGPVSGTTGTFSGAVAAATATFSGNVTLGSSVLETPTGPAPSYTCRAWVNFNGTGTVAIRASGNVSSVVRNATGVYTVNFTTAMPDANYSAVVSVKSPLSNRNTVANLGGSLESDPSTGSFSFVSMGSTNNSLTNAAICNVAIFR